MCNRSRNIILRIERSITTLHGGRTPSWEWQNVSPIHTHTHIHTYTTATVVRIRDQTQRRLTLVLDHMLTPFIPSTRPRRTARLDQTSWSLPQPLSCLHCQSTNSLALPYTIIDCYQCFHSDKIGLKLGLFNYVGLFLRRTLKRDWFACHTQ